MADIPGLTVLWTACDLVRPWNDPTQDIERALAGPSSTVLVGRSEGDIVASAMPGWDGHRATVYYLAVDPECQGRGFGRAMMAAVEAWVGRFGATKLNLVVRAENSKVQAFYESLGYSREDRLNFARRLKD